MGRASGGFVKSGRGGAPMGYVKAPRSGRARPRGTSRVGVKDGRQMGGATANVNVNCQGRTFSRT
eukprot:5833551-Pyramimonas_sp.AAC.1